MNRDTLVRTIIENGIIAIVRADSGDDLTRVIEAVAEGGVRSVEVSMTTPNALTCIESASRRLDGSDILLGVGTVLDATTCRLAVLAGAQYVVSPVMVPEIIRMAHRYAKPALPGAFTPTEIFTAWEEGGDLIKVFPAALGGLDYIKAVRAPLPQIPLVPTGGVNVDNLKDFVAAGAVAFGIGSHLVSKRLVAERDFKGLTENARRFTEALRAARDG